ncbi:HAD family hydrolase [Corallococcus sp. CA047B]|uniref:HAD hydrolase-like protein n=1 Tax=Corallococcus sp. CA047B TaxID=2316729 RepID=UPI000EA2FA86|nr:HAD hydrolase-like protein [Corallococcus sp. CA047B]RKH21758.1 HAD family hydrolase [Corallococcus sp. CA047B]
MGYRLVIFDFDGTLADSADWMRGIFNDVARRYGFRSVSAEELEALRGQDTRAIVAHLGVPAWKMPFIAAHMRKLVTRDAHRIPLFPGVEALLEQLQARGIALAVVSSNSEQNVRLVLGPVASARIRHYACGAGIFGKRVKFRKVLKAAGVRPSEALSVGDEVRDIEAAAAEGIATAAVTWGYATEALLRSRAPTLVLTRLDELSQAVAPFPGA